MTYEELLKQVLENGEYRQDRTGVGTKSIFGGDIRYNLAAGFPLITTKKVHFKSVAEELFWFLRGETNIKTLDATIWYEWADANGSIGARAYGAQWRNWQGSHDQIQNVVESLTNNPQSRRHLVTAWNPAELEDVALPPCHYSFQFYLSNANRLSIIVNQRSADMFLGVPFNLASYALLCHLVATTVGAAPGEIIWRGGDCHIYENHIEQVKEQLTRDVREFPRLEVKRSVRNVWEYELDDIELTGYNPHPRIAAPVAV